MEFSPCQLQNIDRPVVPNKVRCNSKLSFCNKRCEKKLQGEDVHNKVTLRGRSQLTSTMEGDGGGGVTKCWRKMSGGGWGGGGGGGVNQSRPPCMILCSNIYLYERFFNAQCSEFQVPIYCVPIPTFPIPNSKLMLCFLCSDNFWTAILS